MGTLGTVSGGRCFAPVVIVDELSVVSSTASSIDASGFGGFLGFVNRLAGGSLRILVFEDVSRLRADRIRTVTAKGEDYVHFFYGVYHVELSAR